MGVGVIIFFIGEVVIFCNCVFINFDDINGVEIMVIWSSVEYKMIDNVVFCNIIYY